MTVLSPPTVAQTLRRAAVRATLAPSVHNTQPWRFVIGSDTLEVHADATRRLDVLDPSGRQLMISCGCAVLNARASLAATGYNVTVDRLPDRDEPTVVARLRVSGSGDPDPLGALDASIEARHTNRRQFAEDPVPSEVVDALVAAAARDGAVLAPIRTLDDRLATAVLSQRADREQNADPAYRAELRAWTTDDPAREDGVAGLAVAHTLGDAHDDLPLRDFDTHGRGALPARTGSGIDQCVLVLGTQRDDPLDWIRTGEGLQRVLLEVTRRGFAASPLTQVVEVPYTRERLRHELRLTMHPHLLIRIGRAPATPATRRRRLVDMLSETPTVR